MLQPSSASLSAMARPIPRDDPVTSTLLSAIRAFYRGRACDSNFLLCRVCQSELMNEGNVFAELIKVPIEGSNKSGSQARDLLDSGIGHAVGDVAALRSDFAMITYLLPQ